VRLREAWCRSTLSAAPDQRAPPHVRGVRPTDCAIARFPLLPSCAGNQNRSARRKKREAAEASALECWFLDQMMERRALSWSFEQSRNTRTMKLLERYRRRHPSLLDFAAIDCELYGVAQHRRRIIAGSPHLIRRLLAARDDRPSTIADVILAPPSNFVMNHSTNTPTTRAERETTGLRYRRLLPEEHTRSIQNPSYCVMAGASQTWVDDEYNKVARMSLTEAAALQTLGDEHVLSATKARVGIGNAIPSEVARRLLALPRDWCHRAGRRVR
jgi:hypothetical protein